MLIRLLNTLFTHEEINGHDACPTYLHRWQLARWGDRAVYLHRFVGDDWSRDFHDHPKQFFTIGLSGRYFEETPDFLYPHLPNTRIWCAPWKRSFPAEHKHRIRIAPGEECWTLVYVGPKVRDWGFWHKRDGFIPWRTYVGDTEMVASRKTCP